MLRQILIYAPIIGFAFLPFIGPIVSGLAGLFGGRKQQQQQTNTQETDTTVSPELSRNQNMLSDSFTRALIDRFESDPDLSGYQSGGLQTINAASDARSKIINNMLASRGLSFSPAAATAQIAGENARLSDATSFLNQIPLLARQMKGEDITNLIRGFSSLPTATRTRGRTTQEGTQLIPGNMTAGALSGVAQGLFAPMGAGGGTALDAIIRGLGFGK